MAKRQATAEWNGTLKDGSGRMSVASGVFDVPFTYASRFEEEDGTNPEELIGAAHAGCFSMFFSALLTNNGYTPDRIHTTAVVHLGQVDDAPTITKIELETEADVPGIDGDAFMEFAEKAKAGCPVSKALAGPEITLDARLVE